MLMSREAARHFVERKRGNIVNLGSTAAVRGAANGTAYYASKFAVRGMTECWRAELRQHNVRVILRPKSSGHVGTQVEIDSPRAQQDIAQPFNIVGWAADLDAAAGTGIDTLHVWAYPLAGGPPVFLGVPDTGGVRPDVAAVHGDQFRDTGFSLAIEGLPHGNYDIAVFPWSNVSGGFAPPKVVQVTVR